MFLFVLSLCYSVIRITHDRSNRCRPNKVGIGKGWPLEVMYCWCWSGSLFHFLRHCRIGDFTLSHTVTRWLLRHLEKWPTPTRQWIHNILGAIRQTPRRMRIRINPEIRKSGLESPITFGWDCGLGGVCVLWELLYSSLFTIHGRSKMIIIKK